MGSYVIVIASFLLGTMVVEYSGNMSDTQRRTVNNTVLKTKGHVIVVCSDMLSRGVDFPDVSYVINYDAPQSHQVNVCVCVFFFVFFVTYSTYRHMYISAKHTSCCLKTWMLTQLLSDSLSLSPHALILPLFFLLGMNYIYIDHIKMFTELCSQSGSHCTRR
jgi:hypothetical protein